MNRHEHGEYDEMQASQGFGQTLVPQGLPSGSLMTYGLRSFIPPGYQVWPKVPNTL
jgi:hypothetical protein